MRSSNLKYCENATYLKHCAKTKKRFYRTGTFIFAIIVAISVIAIPSTTLIMHAEALANTEPSTVEVVTEATELVTERKVTEKSEKKEKSEKAKKNVAVKAETEPVQETTEATQPETTAPTEPTQASDGYSPEYVQLSSYDREKLERLVTGEAGGLGYEGCVLVAQAIRDSMNESKTSSIDKIINDYQYSGSTDKPATEDAKKAVSFIFDQNGSAVNHRILYFYATDMVQSDWHESQNYITTCGNMRFF